MMLVYQAYGPSEVVRQCQFSILSYLRWGRQDRILVYTDEAETLSRFFKGHEKIEIISTGAEQFKAWRGKIDFVHRIKIEILLDASRRYRDSLLYVDADTIFMHDPKDLFGSVSPGQSVMHLLETRLDQARDPLTKKVANFCRGENFALKRGIVSVPLATEMWNAGVIGLHESRVNLLDRILELTDAAYEKYQKHVIEQLAFSYFLQSVGKIVAAEKQILHYWSAKEHWQVRIDAFLSQYQSFDTAVSSLGTFNFSQPEEVKKKSAWEKLFS